MTERKESFKKLVSEEKTNTLQRAQIRIEQRKFLRLSQRISLRILSRLDELGWSQKDLAERMKVSPQQVNKWVRGNANFKLMTLADLSEALGISLIEVPLNYDSIRQDSNLKVAAEPSVHYEAGKKK